MNHPNAINVAEAANAAQRRQAEHRRAMGQLAENLAALRAPGPENPNEARRRWRQLIAENEAERLARATPPSGLTWKRMPNGRVIVFKNLNQRIKKLQKYLNLSVNFENYNKTAEWNSLHNEAKILANELGFSLTRFRNYHFPAFHPTVLGEVNKELEKLTGHS